VGSHLRPSSIPDTLIPIPADLQGKGLSKHCPHPLPAWSPHSQGTPGPPFLKDQLLPSLLLPFPSEGHVRAEVEGLREGPRRTRPLAVALPPRAPPLPLPSLRLLHIPLKLRSAPLGWGAPPSSHITALHSLLFSSLPSRVGWGREGAAGGANLSYPSPESGRGAGGTLQRKSCKSGLKGPWHFIFINRH
jgi:hypothetical protein